MTVAAIAIVVALLVAWRMMPPRATGCRQGTGASGAVTVQATGTGCRVRVATFNIHRGRGRDGVRDLRRTAAALAGIDVAGLQECAGSMTFATRNQARRIAGELRCGWLFAPSQTRWLLRAHGNALLCRVPVGRWTREPLPGNTRRAPRNLLSAEIELAGEKVTVLVTHLSRKADREQQLALVLERLRRCRCAILLADLNETRDHHLLANLPAAGVTDAVAAALGDEDPAQRIDWILVRGWRVSDGGMVDDGASDHPCYWVTLSRHRDAAS